MARAASAPGIPCRRLPIRPAEPFAFRAPTMKPDLPAEVVVVGAGPAGALGARQLARFGLRVVLVHRARRRQHLGESLGASAPRLLASYDLELPESVFSPRPHDHFVRWGGREDRIAAQPDEDRGHREGQRLVWRDRLDAWALAEARRAGVLVVEGSAAARPGGGIVVRRGDGRTVRIAAPAFVDASGRSGVLTRERRQRPAHRTTALTAHFPGGPEPGTLVASFADGWVWSAPLPDGQRDVTVLADAGEASGRAEILFREAIAEVGLDGFVAGEPTTPIRAADATPYLLDWPGEAPEAPATSSPRTLLPVGDAMSALDPLTGLGVMKAMDSGLTGAVALRTALARPDCADLALRFHADKERGLAAESAARIAGFYAEERRFADRPFWRRRSGPAPAPPPPPPAPLPDPDAPLFPAPGAGVETRGVLEGDWIVPAETLVLPGRPRPAHRYGGTNLVAVFRRAATGLPASQLARDRPEAGSAALWLVREGFLTPGGRTERTGQTGTPD